MGITMIATGGVPGNRSVLLFYPEGRTYSPPAKQAVVSLPSVGPCALRGGSRSLRRAPDNTAEPAGFGRHCLCGWQTAVASFASSLQIVVPALGQPATRLRQTCHRQLCRRDGRCHPAPSIFFCLRQKKQKRLPAGSRKDVIHYGDLSSGS